MCFREEKIFKKKKKKKYIYIRIYSLYLREKISNTNCCMRRNSSCNLVETLCMKT